MRKTPRWLLLAGAVLLVVAVAVSLVHKPSRAERASDMSGLLQEVNTDIESCAAGVSESLTALHEVQAEQLRDSKNVDDAISIAQYGASNCSPANNEQIDDLESYQVPESLDSFGLVGAVNGLVSWAAPDAERVQDDVAQLLTASTPAAKSRAQAALSQALVALDAQRKAVDAAIDKAIKALAMHSAPPQLPG